MIQFLNVRQNRSLKKIDRYNHQQAQLASDYSQQVHKNLKPKFLTKTVHLKSLFRSRTVESHDCNKFSLKSCSLSNNLKKQKRNRYDCQILKLPGFNSVHVQRTIKGKQNRPASMNEQQNPSKQLVKQNLYNTEKIQRLTHFFQVSRQETEINNEEEVIKENEHVSNLKIAKQNNRAKCMKLCKKEQRIKTQSKIPQVKSPQSEFVDQKRFRKDIIDHIFNKVRIKQETKTEYLKTKCIRGIQSIFLMKSTTQQNGKKEDPVQRKQADNIFHADCSTIEEKQDCNSSFISKKDYRQFTKYLENLNSCSNDPSQIQIRKKIEMGKFRKKFPENFFK